MFLKNWRKKKYSMKVFIRGIAIQVTDEPADRNIPFHRLDENFVKLPCARLSRCDDSTEEGERQ